MRLFIQYLSVSFHFLLLLSCDTGKQYTYEVCIASDATPCKEISTEVIGIADTTVCFVQGHLFSDTQNDSLSYSKVKFIELDRNSKYGAITDSVGDYHLILDPGVYYVTASSIGYTPCTLDTFVIESGHIVKLDFRLGTGIRYKTVQFTSDKPLNKKKQIRVAKEEYHN